MANDILKKISGKDISVGVIGMGYVGIPLAITIAQKNIQTIGFDIIQSRVDMINKGESYIKDIKNHTLKSVVNEGTLQATTNFSHISSLDIIIICVPTPLSKNKEPNLQYVIETSKNISKYIQKGQLVSLESTTYPGTTTDIVKPILESSGLQCSRDFFLAYSPEREDPGNENFSTSDISKVVGGVTEIDTNIAVQFYQLFIDSVVSVSSSSVAEAVKLTENIFRAVNIASVNELKVVFDKMNIDVWEVIEAAATKPFGYMPFYPGPGLGGHCIPIDPLYLSWKAREYNTPTRFIDLAGEVNSSMPTYVVNNLSKSLNQYFRKALNGSEILVIGVSYKANIDDYRESPALDIIHLLEQLHVNVSYYDPFVEKLNHEKFGQKNSLKINEIEQSSFDGAIICSNHSCIVWERILKKIPLVVDTRNSLVGKIQSETIVVKS